MQRTRIRYQDFDLLLDSANGGYEARVLASPAGQARQRFARLSALEAERLKTFGAIVSGHGVRRRRIDAPDMQAAKAVGGDLFERVLSGAVGECWRTSLDLVRRQENMGLRVRLRMGSAPELAELPWEFLYDAVENQFLSLSVYTPLVRYLDVRRPVQPLAVKPPLRVLVMISSPSGVGDLDVEQEWRQVRDAVADLEARGLVTFDRLDRATLEELQRRLRREEYHVFHYIGHAGFDEVSDDGVLLLEDEQGRSERVSAERLGIILHDESTLRLAILNACEGARSSRRDPFSGLAQSLVQKGIPAVIAMQYEISDDAAITLSHEFYRALGEGYPADAALGEARKMISHANELEWGTPVLFLRSPDAVLFDVHEADEASQRSGQLHGLLCDARAALAGGRWNEAAEKAEAALSLEPSHVEAAGIAAQTRRTQEVLRAQREAEETRRRDEDARLRQAQEEASRREERILAGFQVVASGRSAKRRWLPGCSVAITLSFAALAGILGVSQLRLSGIGSADGSSSIESPPADEGSPPPPIGQTGGAQSGTGAGDIKGDPDTGAPPSDPATVESPRLDRVRAEIRDAVQHASEVEAEAFQTGDASLLYEAYGGQALDLLLQGLAALGASGMHQEARLVDREWQSWEIDRSESTVLVTIVEVWTTEFHQNGTDLCLGRIERHPVPQRLTLSRASGRWLIVGVESHDATPEPLPCR